LGGGVTTEELYKDVPSSKGKKKCSGRSKVRPKELDCTQTNARGEEIKRSKRTQKGVGQIETLAGGYYLAGGSIRREGRKRNPVSSIPRKKDTVMTH